VPDLKPNEGAGRESFGGKRRSVAKEGLRIQSVELPSGIQ
jgi:hypothetical protein